MDIKTYLIEHYPEKKENVEEYIKWNGEYIDKKDELTVVDIKSFLIYLYPSKKVEIAYYLKWNEKYFDSKLRKLYKNVDKEKAVETITERIMEKVFPIRL